MAESYEKLSFVSESCLDDQTYFVFRNEEGKFRLIEASDYRSYRLTPGLILMARVREKGCAGNEIMELMHPYYKEGIAYFFVVVRVGSVTYNDRQIHFIVIKDEFENEFKIRAVADNNMLSPGEIIQCKLTEQKKGKLHFSMVY